MTENIMTMKELDETLIDLLRTIRKANAEIECGDPENAEIYLDSAELEANRARAQLRELAIADGINPDDDWKLA